jgi:hypothetical protein
MAQIAMLVDIEDQRASTLVCFRPVPVAGHFFGLSGIFLPVVEILGLIEPPCQGKAHFGSTAVSDLPT